MEHILAVEGGGTKCEALLMNAEGEALAFHAAYPAGVNAMNDSDRGRGRSVGAALEAIQGVLKVVNPTGTLHLVWGSGATSPRIRHELKAAHVAFWYAKEEKSARACAGVDEALVALAGTGAFGHLHTATGGWNADGAGPLSGDWGGAYQIGREGLRAATRSFIHPRRPTALGAAVARQMGMGEHDPKLSGALIQEGLRIFSDRTEVARYASLVDRIAREGDPVAIRILEDAAADLAETLEYLVEKAGAGERDLPFVGTGGVIQRSDIFWTSLVRRVTAFLPRCRPMRQAHPQSVGLALAGLMQAAEAGDLKADLARVRERLFQTLPGVLNGKDRKGAA